MSFDNISQFQYQWAVTTNNNQSKIHTDPIQWADIILVQRYFPLNETQPILDQIIESGKPVIYELDDDLLSVPQSHPLYHNFQKTAPYIRKFLPKASLVTVTTESLRQKILPYNANVTIIPNCIDESSILNPCSLTDPGKTVITYMGSPTHSLDLKLVEDILFTIRDKFRSDVGFIFWGCTGTRLEELGKVLPFDDSYKSFLNKTGSVHFDIGLAPLTDSLFNRCKSNIKWLEYSAYARAGIYSDLEPYNACVEHGKTGLLVKNTAKDWQDALEYLITHPDERKAMGRAARKDAFARFGLSKNLHRYLDIYQQLLKR